jgi:hypothetical protein
VVAFIGRWAGDLAPLAEISDALVKVTDHETDAELEQLAGGSQYKEKENVS